MSTYAIVGIVIVVIAAAILIATTARILVTRRQLRERYGDEYDRVVTEKGGRAAGEAELRQRERRHAKLDLKDLSDEQRARYRTEWTELQAQFVDDPNAAVHEADQLISRLMADRGYPVGDFDDRVSHLSVEHSSILNRYRDAHDISVRNDSGTASTEELRQALVNYRELAGNLLGDESLADGGPTSSAAPAPVSAPVTPVGNPSPVTPVDNPAPATPADNAVLATPIASPDGSDVRPDAADQDALDRDTADYDTADRDAASAADRDAADRDTADRSTANRDTTDRDAVDWSAADRNVADRNTADEAATGTAGSATPNAMPTDSSAADTPTSDSPAADTSAATSPAADSLAADATSTRTPLTSKRR